MQPCWIRPKKSDSSSETRKRGTQRAREATLLFCRSALTVDWRGGEQSNLLQDFGDARANLFKRLRGELIFAEVLQNLGGRDIEHCYDVSSLLRIRLFQRESLFLYLTELTLSSVVDGGTVGHS